MLHFILENKNMCYMNYIILTLSANTVRIKLSTLLNI